MKSRSIAPVVAEDPAELARLAVVTPPAIELGRAGAGIAAVAATGCDNTAACSAGGVAEAEGAAIADTLTGMTGGGRAIGIEGGSARAPVTGRAGAGMGPTGMLVGRGLSTGGATGGIATGAAPSAAGVGGLAPGRAAGMAALDAAAGTLGAVGAGASTGAVTTGAAEIV